MPCASVRWPPAAALLGPPTPGRAKSPRTSITHLSERAGRHWTADRKSEDRQNGSTTTRWDMVQEFLERPDLGCGHRDDFGAMFRGGVRETSSEGTRPARPKRSEDSFRTCRRAQCGKGKAAVFLYPLALNGVEALSFESRKVADITSWTTARNMHEYSTPEQSAMSRKPEQRHSNLLRRREVEARVRRSTSALYQTCAMGAFRSRSGSA